jgi:hypothetical protein
MLPFENLRKARSTQAGTDLALTAPCMPTLQLFTLVLAACLSIGYDPPSAVFSVRR